VNLSDAAGFPKPDQPPDFSNRSQPGQPPTDARPGESSAPPPPNTATEQAEETTFRVFGHMAELAPERREGEVARDMVVPVCISEIIGSDRVSTGGARIYLSGLYPDARRPKDAIEQMLFDQAAIAHQRLAQLQAQAHKAKTLEAAKVYNQAATRLMGEFRRFALAIKQYQQPPSAKSFAVIHQQNVAAGTAGQQNSYVDQSKPGETQVSLSSRQTELGDKAQVEPIGGRFGAENEESAESCCGDNQRIKAPTLG
jgi:hypothetical protein